MGSEDSSNLILEACVDSHQAALDAVQAGAQRIELCSRLDLGGLSPHFRLIRACIKSVSVPLKVMVRPRGGDFLCSEKDLKQMLKEILMLKRFGVQELVLGCLDEKDEVDMVAMDTLVKASFGMKITFHRAIDASSDPLLSLEKLRGFKNITSILSSGGAETALDGKEVLRKMKVAAGERFTLIAAGKITWGNLSKVHEAIGANEYHGRKIVNIYESSQNSGFTSERRGRPSRR